MLSTNQALGSFSPDFSSSSSSIMPSSYSLLAPFPKLLFSFLLFLLFPLVLFPSTFISTSSSTATVLNTNASTDNYMPLSSTRNSSHQICFHQHFSTLLQLKHGFDFNYSDTNLSSWNANNLDCCSWEGIHCNPFTGHVISLNLSSLYIGGLLDFQSLFQLQSLERLDLSDNYWLGGSPIPSGFGQLNNLTHLNLRWNNLYGQIPLDIFHLTRLVSLDLSFNSYVNASNNAIEYLYLEMSSSGMEQLFGNFSGLRELFLDRANLSTMGSQWSRILAYALPSLHKLRLSHCSLFGQIHPSFFRLHSLTLLDLSYYQLSSPVLEFILNLTSLTYLRLSGCDLQHKFPTSIFNLPKLQLLDISYNQFLVVEFSKFSINSTIQQLAISGTEFHGNLADIPRNFKSLTWLEISDCNLIGPVPQSFANLSQLVFLDLSYNNFQGPIPIWIFELTELRNLDLSSNNFSGAIDLSLLQNLKKLWELDLSDNSLRVTNNPGNSFISTSFPQLWYLSLRSCNINNIPNMLRNQEKIEHLDLSKNGIRGKIPQWIWKVGNKRLYYFNLSHNSLEGLEGPFPHLSLTSMQYFDLSSNFLKGSILVPPASSSFFSLANNKLDGEVPSLICDAKFLEVLDLSNNNFTGLIPKCLGKISKGIFKVLNLGKNAFHGPLFQTFEVSCALETLDLSNNYLEGQMPRSLTNCQMLTVLNFGNNQIHDEFPSQLGNLSNLRVLVLRSNNFFGSIRVPWTSREIFPCLEIIDLSFNNFSGKLPSNLFSSWKMMKNGGTASKFLIANISGTSKYYQDKVFLVWKGLEIEFEKILLAVTIVDFSYNQLEGDIPTSIGELKALHVLNLSHNHFQGEIPALLQNLRALESLDLSNNSLSGKIPWKLVELSFMSILNLSQNQLTGRIPQGRQFDTFQNDSFLGNSELCGFPLLRNCEENVVAIPPTTKSNDEESKPNLMWIAFGAGHGMGFGMFFWTLALWRRGRRAFFMFVDKVFFSCLSSLM